MTRWALKVVNEAKKKKMDLSGNTGLLITQYPPSCVFFLEESCWEGRRLQGEVIWRQLIN